MFNYKFILAEKISVVNPEIALFDICHILPKTAEKSRYKIPKREANRPSVLLKMPRGRKKPAFFTTPCFVLFVFFITVFKPHGQAERVLFAAVLAEVSRSDKLERVARLRVGNGFFRLAVFENRQ